MKARRTPWWYYVLAVALGLLAGIGLAKYGEISGLPLVGAPWIVPVILAVLGLAVLYRALQIHKYTTKDPEKRAQLKPLDPQKAFSTLVACKALGVAGAALTGWYGGQLIMSLPHGEATFYSQAILECAIAAIVCIVDMIIGIQIFLGNANHRLLGHAGNKLAILRVHLRLTQATSVSRSRRILHIQMPLIDVDIAIPPHRMIDRSERNAGSGDT